MELDEMNPKSDETEPEFVGGGEDGAKMVPKTYSFKDLCRIGDEVWIVNEGQFYRLRRTRTGKLILTK